MSTKITRGQLPAVKAKLMKAQNGVCPLCQRPFSEMEEGNAVVDHDHTHGFIRAVLCRNCNGREGEILSRSIRGAVGGDNIEWLQRLVDYWRLHAEPQTPYIHPTHKNELEKAATVKRRRARLARERRAKKKEAK